MKRADNMRDNLRITRICQELEMIWSKYPELRLCQLIDNGLVDYFQEHRDAFYLEDDEFLEHLRNWDRWMESKK